MGLLTDIKSLITDCKTLIGATTTPAAGTVNKQLADLVAKTSTGIDQVTSHANEVVLKTGSLTGLEGTLPDTTAGDLVGIRGALGATNGAAVTTDATGTVQQYLRGLVKLLAAMITSNKLQVDVNAGAFSATGLATSANQTTLVNKFSATPGATTFCVVICGQQQDGTVTPLLVDASGSLIPHSA